MIFFFACLSFSDWLKKLCIFILFIHIFVDSNPAQVREQQRYIAQRIRQEVEQRRHHELELLEEELRAEWELQQGERVNKLHMLYQESLSLLGQGHRCAKENVRHVLTEATGVNFPWVSLWITVVFCLYLVKGTKPDSYT